MLPPQGEKNKMTELSVITKSEKLMEYILTINNM